MFTIPGRGARDRNNSKDGRHHEDHLDDGNFLGLVQNDDGGINRRVVIMLAATEAAITPWGGKFSPAKTHLPVNETSTHVMAIVQDNVGSSGATP